MNAADLPPGFAPFLLIRRSVEGVDSVGGRFVSEDLAEHAACELRQLATGRTYRVVHDWKTKVLSFARKKTGSIAIMRFDNEVSRSITVPTRNRTCPIPTLPTEE